MLIDFVVVKTAHSTVPNALALEKLIRKADLISFESPFLREDQARNLENYFASANALPDDERAALVSRLMDEGSTAEDVRGQYSKVIDALVVKHRKPVLLLERWENEADANYWRERGERIIGHRTDINHFLIGNYTEAMRIFFQLAETQREAVPIRDTNMGKNAKTIWHRIRNVYPELAARRKITYLVEIGKYHNVEVQLESVKNAKVRIGRVKQDEYVIWADEVYRKVVIENAAYAECQDEIARRFLAQGYCVASKAIYDRKIPTLLFRLSQAVVKNLGVDDLVAVSAMLLSSPRVDRAEIFKQFFGDKKMPVPNSMEECHKLLSLYN